MACIINNGYTLQCASIGGVEEVLIGTFDDAISYVLDADNVVTGASAPQTLYKMEQDAEFAGLTQNGVFTRENGSVHYESVLSMKFIDYDKDLRNTILALGRAPIVAVIKSNSGKYYLLGLETPGRATAGTSGVNVNYSDLDGATLEVTFKSANGAYLVDASTIGVDFIVA